MKKRIISFVLVLVMTLGFLPTLPIANAATSGTCGENLTWTLNGTELTISGTGEMEYYGESSLPWGYEITSVTVQKGVTTISTGAFRYCRNLTSVIIADSVTSIGNYAFSDCQSLLSITIPDGVTKINFCAFLGCSNLDSITIPNSLSYFSYDGLPDGANIHYDGNRVQFVERFGETHFFDENECEWKDINLYTTYNEYSFQVNDTTITAKMNEITGELILSGSGTIPDQMMYRHIISTGDRNKYYEYLRDFVKSIKIEPGITAIGEYAFGFCENLKTVIIPASVTSIGNDAFVNCNNITDVYYGGDKYQYHNLSNAPDPENLHSTIKEYSFPISDNITASINETTGEYRLSGLGEMPDGVDVFSSVTPYYLTNLIKTVEIESGITNVGSYAFSDCKNLTSVTIPDTVMFIGEFAFEGCSSLTSIKIPDGVPSIGAATFAYCSGLKSITIPSSIKTIGNSAFVDCTSLEKVEISDIRKWLDIEFGLSKSSPFISGTKLYVNNEQVTNLVIPSDVTKINAYAFSGLNTITSLTIPTSVKEIGENAFANCTGITDIYYGGTRSDFAQIAIAEGNSRLAFANIHYTEPHTHKFDNACDTTCNGCDYERTITHDYKDTYNAAGHFEECTICGYIGEGEPHVFDNACDKDCACGYTRITTHTFGNYVYNNDATVEKDGTKTRICSVCGHKETVTATGTKLPKPQAQTNPFTDIKAKDFYYKPTLWAVANNITTGTSKTTFSPEEPCTRGQVVTFLWRAAGCPEPTSTTMPFTDVGSKAFYRKAVLWAVEQGITSGTSATTFGPNETCTRGQIATFLWRAKGKPAPKSSNMPFVDVSTKNFAYKAVLWAVENKITSGTSKTTFAPSEPCTRGQIVTFLYRAYK